MEWFRFMRAMVKYDFKYKEVYLLERKMNRKWLVQFDDDGSYYITNEVNLLPLHNHFEVE